MKRPLSAGGLAALVLLVAAIAAGCRREPGVPPPAPASEAAPSPAPPAPVAAPAVTPAAVPSPEEFLRRETAWAQALANKDGAALERLLAPEFFITGVGSTVDDPVGGRSEWLETVAKYPWPLHAVADVRVAATSDTAVVKCVWSGIYPANSLTPEGGVLQLLITDVWVRQGDDWVVLARHTSLPRPPQ
jgi:hypothetical protein